MNFPSPFRSLHSSLFIAFHRLSLPFIAAPSHCPPALCSPPFCPRLAPVLSSPRPALSPCPRIPPLHTCFPPASSPLLFHTSVIHAPLSALLCFASLFYSLHCFTPLCFTLSHCFTSFVLFLPPLLYSLPLFTPFALFTHIVLHPFFTPRQPPQTRPRHRKRQRFSHFSKKFCKKPLTKQKKVLY